MYCVSLREDWPKANYLSYYFLIIVNTDSIISVVRPLAKDREDGLDSDNVSFPVLSLGFDNQFHGFIPSLVHDCSLFPTLNL